MLLVRVESGQRKVGLVVDGLGRIEGIVQVAGAELARDDDLLHRGVRRPLGAVEDGHAGPRHTDAVGPVPDDQEVVRVGGLVVAGFSDVHRQDRAETGAAIVGTIRADGIIGRLLEQHIAVLAAVLGMGRVRDLGADGAIGGGPAGMGVVVDHGADHFEIGRLCRRDRQPVGLEVVGDGISGVGAGEHLGAGLDARPVGDVDEVLERVARRRDDRLQVHRRTGDMDDGLLGPDIDRDAHHPVGDGLDVVAGADGVIERGEPLDLRRHRPDGVEPALSRAPVERVQDGVVVAVLLEDRDGRVTLDRALRPDHRPADDRRGQRQEGALETGMGAGADDRAAPVDAGGRLQGPLVQLLDLRQEVVQVVQFSRAVEEGTLTVPLGGGSDHLAEVVDPGRDAGTAAGDRAQGGQPARQAIVKEGAGRA